jgi:hypothetical protein
MTINLKHLVSAAMLAGSLLILAGCPKVEPKDDFSFDVTMTDGSAISGTQTLNYGQEATLALVPVSVASIDAKAPDGWTATASVSKKTLVIKSPDPTNKSAAASGNVTVTATGTSGASKTVTIAVAVKDADVAYSIKEDVSSGISVLYGSTTTLGVTSANVSTVIAGGPKGWTVTADASSVKIVAPARDAAGAETSGKITLSPYSAHGTAGNNVSFNVEISVKSPYLEFTPGSLLRADFGSVTEVSATKVENVVSLAISSQPKGWTASVDMSKGKVTVTAPSLGSMDYDGEGEIVATATSETGDTRDFSMPVSLKGINSAADLCAFGDSVSKAAAVSVYSDGSTVVLNADIDLSGTPRNIYVGNDSVYFTGSFDGRGHTVTMAITASDYNAGLFSALGEGTTVQNLNLAGTISSSLYDEASANKMKIGPLAIVDMGASLTNVNSSVAVTYDAKFAGGYCGGLVALNAGQKSVYDNCHVSGSFNLSGMRYIGGIIGLIEENSKGEMKNCTHTGKMTLDFSEASATGKQRIGGIVGCNDKGYWTYTSSSNTGDIDYKCKSDDSMYALGGFVGDGSGTYTDCFNTGNITDLLGTKTVRGTRRIGGFIGCNTNDGYAAKMTGCYNTGNVSGCSNYIGGFIGISENMNAEPCSLTNCYNSGNLTVISETSISGMFGGFAAVFYNKVHLDGCSNTGKVYGYTNRSAGGLIGCGADDLVLENCKNTGVVDVHTAAAAISNDYRPYVAGLVAVRGNSTIYITKCANTGAVTGEVQKAECVQSIYVSEKVIESGAADAVVCDQATKDASKDAKVTATIFTK